MVSIPNDNRTLVHVSALPRVPILPGSLHAYLRLSRTFLGVLDDTAGDHLQKVGPIFRFPFPMFPERLHKLIEITFPYWHGTLIMVHSPQLIKQLYTQPAGVIDHDGSKFWLRFVLGSHSPFMLSGKDHLKVRKAIVPELSQKQVDKNRAISLEVLDRTIDEIPLDEPILLHDYFAYFAQELILRIVLGLEDREELAHYRDVMNRAVEHSQRSGWGIASTFLRLSKRNPWAERGDEIPDEPRYRKAHALRREADALIYGQIAKLRAQPNDSIASRLVALSHDDSFWSDKMLRDAIVTLLVAGHDTSVNSYSWSTEFLLRDDVAREKLLEEIRLGATDAWARACSNEALRLKPPVWAQVSTAIETFELGGYRIEKGSFLFVDSRGVHADESLYPEQDSYKPERFLNRVPKDQYSFVSFSMGRHRCPGRLFFAEESTLLLHRIFGRLEMELLEPEVDRTRMGGGFFNRPSKRLPVIVRRRKSASDVPAFDPTIETTDRPVREDDPIADETAVNYQVETCPFTATART